MTPAWSAKAAKRLRAIRRQGFCPPRRVISRRTAVSNRAHPSRAGAVQVAGVAIHFADERTFHG